MTPRTATRETPFKLAYITEAVIPIEIGLLSYQSTNYEEGANKEELRANLDLVAEIREEARIKIEAYKQKVANSFNKGVKPKSLHPANWALIKADIKKSRAGIGKLEENWVGPYRIDQVM